MRSPIVAIAAALLACGCPYLDAAPNQLSNIPLPAPSNYCYSVLPGAGASDHFGKTVGHAIHSMTVSDLRLFDPNATEANGVPTINQDLRSDEAILSYAPDAKTADTDYFATDGMKAIDLVLEHMDDKAHNIKAYSPLEQIVHAFHMKEVWAKALVEFEQLKSKPPSAEVCRCASDVESNGVMRMLRYTALAIREPVLVYSASPTKKQKREYRFLFKRAATGSSDELVNSENSAANALSQNELFVQKEGMIELDSAKAWQAWKRMIKSMPNEGSFDTALFLYCAIQKAHA